MGHLLHLNLTLTLHTNTVRVWWSPRQSLTSDCTRKTPYPLPDEHPPSIPSHIVDTMIHRNCPIFMTWKSGSGNKTSDKEEGWRIHLESQGIPVRTPVSNSTVSGVSPSRCSDRPEYNKRYVVEGRSVYQMSPHKPEVRLIKQTPNSLFGVCFF